MTKFYIGSSLNNSKIVEEYTGLLEEKGWSQTYNWLKNIHNEISKKELKSYAKEELEGIKEADVVIIYLPAGRGAHVELGLALGLSKNIFLCANDKSEFSVFKTVSFYELPEIKKLVGTPQENTLEIIRQTKKL